METTAPTARPPIILLAEAAAWRATLERLYDTTIWAWEPIQRALVEAWRHRLPLDWTTDAIILIGPSAVHACIVLLLPEDLRPNIVVR